MEPETEIWVSTLEPFAAYLQVSNLGRVKRLSRVVKGKNIDSIKFIQPETILNLQPNNHGYIMVSVKIDGKTQFKSVHSLVIESFEGKIPSGFQINHKNGIKTDNKLDNLEIVTASDNIKHAYKNNLKVGCFATSNGAFLDTVFHWLNIETGEELEATRLEMMQNFGLHSSSLSNLIYGKAVTHKGWMIWDFVKTML